jgi:hypothetical protein
VNFRINKIFFFLKKTLVRVFVVTLTNLFSTGGIDKYVMPPTLLVSSGMSAGTSTITFAGVEYMRLRASTIVGL